MRTKKQIFKKNIRVTKEFKEKLKTYANGNEVADVIANIIIWHNIDFEMNEFEKNLLTSIKYSSVRYEPGSVDSKSETITVKLNWKDFEVLEKHCIMLGIETSEGIRRAIRQVALSEDEKKKDFN